MQKAINQHAELKQLKEHIAKLTRWNGTMRNVKSKTIEREENHMALLDVGEWTMARRSRICEGHSTFDDDDEVTGFAVYKRIPGWSIE